jgi:hypothetical protein
LRQVNGENHPPPAWFRHYLAGRKGCALPARAD